MPLWLARIIALTLFTAAMALLSAVLKVAVPVVLDPIGGRIGWWPTLGLIATLILALGLYGFWPRDPAGRMRPLLPRRR